MVFESNNARNGRKSAAMSDGNHLTNLPEELRKKSNQLLMKAGVVSLASVDENGYPRVCILSCLKPSDIGTIIVSTGTNGTKVSHFQKNPKASVCFHDDRDSVTLVGEVEFITDLSIKKDVFLDWMYDHFTGVDDPNYCVIAFHPTTACAWLEGQFGTYACL